MKQRCFVRLSRCRTTANYKQHPCTMMVPVVITAMLSLLYSVRGIKENRKERKRCSANNSDPHFPYLSLFLFVLFFFCIDSRILIVFFSSFAFLMRATLVNNGKHTSPMVYTMCDRFVYCFNTPGFFVLFFWIVGKHQKNSCFFFSVCKRECRRELSTILDVS